MEHHSDSTPKVAVVIPCFKVRDHILSVIEGIGPECTAIYVVDDCCPVQSGTLVEEKCRDSRVSVIRHAVNKGVGGAVMTGYRQAVIDGADIIVKVDGDGQMDPALLPLFVEPIAKGRADYTKGNRFFDLEKIERMPKVRILGNAVLSFLAKISTGYWSTFDPTNGYTAIHARVVDRLPLHKISERYFFETDLLFRLGTFRAVVEDVPMDAVYADEKSNLSIAKVLPEFAFKHARNFIKRIVYNYYLRDVSLASIELPIGVLLMISGVIFGLHHWVDSVTEGQQASAGTVMIAALQIIVGMQLLLSFIGFDVSGVPREALHSRLFQHRVKKPDGD